jgi:sugar phosphate isomerase/epimerase
MTTTVSRRSFLTAASSATLVQSAFGTKKIPVGVELYSVRTEMAKSVPPCVVAAAKMGYEGVEFYGDYIKWTTDFAKEIRKLLDDNKIKCYSTHNGNTVFDPANIDKAIELNSILGSRYIVMASAGRVEGLDGWKKVAEKLNAGAEKMKKARLKAGFHNHQVEFRRIEGTRPMDVLAQNTSKDVILQLDVGTCVEVGEDPVAWINQNPGRIRSIHCKDYSRQPGKGYRVLFGEGDAPWKQIFEAAEKTGGVEFYLIEQEGYDLPPFETIQKCLENFKKIHG